MFPDFAIILTAAFQLRGRPNAFAQAFMILDSNRSMIASSPEFCSSSSPLIETATAAWRMGNSAAVNTWLGAIFKV